MYVCIKCMYVCLYKVYVCMFLSCLYQVYVCMLVSCYTILIGLFPSEAPSFQGFIYGHMVGSSQLNFFKTHRTVTLSTNN